METAPYSDTYLVRIPYTSIPYITVSQPCMYTRYRGTIFFSSNIPDEKKLYFRKLLPDDAFRCIYFIYFILNILD